MSDLSKPDLSRKVIITCAVTGGIHTPTMSDALPFTPEDIARQSIEQRDDVAIGHELVKDTEKTANRMTDIPMTTASWLSLKPLPPVPTVRHSVLAPCQLAPPDAGFRSALLPSARKRTIPPDPALAASSRSKIIHWWQGGAH